MQTRSVLIVAVGLSVAIAALPGEALAGVKCKAGWISGMGFSMSAVAASWSNNARKAYGAAWSNYGLARNKRFTSQYLPPAETLTTVTATPCRRS